MKRKVINIDEEKCNGCGLCIPDCPEGALQIIDGKARLVSDLFCDGLGACIGSCPQNAIAVFEREAKPYNEKRVMANIVNQGELVIQAHLEHLHEHGETKLFNEAIEYLNVNKIQVPEAILTRGNKEKYENKSCPGSASMTMERDHGKKKKPVKKDMEISSELRQWPVQLMLLNPDAVYFDNADLLLASDCVPFAYGGFHRDFLKDKIVIIFCPKLDPHIDEYIEKMTAILSNHNINSITVARMEVPCCGGIDRVLDEALKRSGKEIPVRDYIITIKGKVA